MEEATTDATLVHEWWSAPGLGVPNVLTVTGASLGAVSVYASLVEVIVQHPWFISRPTPVLIIPDMPLAYFLVRPPIPLTAISDEARVLNDGTPLPLPPSALNRTAVSWLVSPEEAGSAILLGDELADLIRVLKMQVQPEEVGPLC